MAKFIEVNNTKVSVGDKLISNYLAGENGLCPPKTIVTIILIKNDGGQESAPLIGVRSNKRFEGWHDLDGNTEPHRGLWLTRDTLMDNFDIIYTDMEVCEDFTFKNKNLKGKKCRVLLQDRNSEHFMVEFKEDIGGSGADGMGKSKHCAIIPSHALKKVSDSVSAVKQR